MEALHTFALVCRFGTYPIETVNHLQICFIKGWSSQSFRVRVSIYYFARQMWHWEKQWFRSSVVNDVGRKFWQVPSNLIQAHATATVLIRCQGKSLWHMLLCYWLKQVNITGGVGAHRNFWNPARTATSHGEISKTILSKNQISLSTQSGILRTTPSSFSSLVREEFFGERLDMGQMPVGTRRRCIPTGGDVVIDKRDEALSQWASDWM